jgi:hypothetical protein
MRFRVAARKDGYRMTLQNGLEATFYRLDSPVVSKVRSICINTGLWDSMYNPQKSLFAAEVFLHGESVWLIFRSLDCYVAFKGWSYQSEEIIRVLTKKFEDVSEWIALVVYKNESYLRNEAKVFLEAIKHKTPVSIMLLLRPEKPVKCWSAI